MKLTPEERCRVNVIAWFKENDGPLPVFLTEESRKNLGIVVPVHSPTRAFVWWSTEVMKCLREHSRTWTMGTTLPDHDICPGDVQEDGGRESGRVRYALQWILHGIGMDGVVEIDFDGWNPGEGLAPAALHFFAEWLPHKIAGKKTDPFAVAKHRKWVEV